MFFWGLLVLYFSRQLTCLASKCKTFSLRYVAADTSAQFSQLPCFALILPYLAEFPDFSPLPLLAKFSGQPMIWAEFMLKFWVSLLLQLSHFQTIPTKFPAALPALSFVTLKVRCHFFCCLGYENWWWPSDQNATSSHFLPIPRINFSGCCCFWPFHSALKYLETFNIFCQIL